MGMYGMIEDAYPNLTTTTETVNTEWLRIARPIIRSYIAMADVGFYSRDWLDADDAERAARKAGDKAAEYAARNRKDVYHEAKGICEAAERKLLELVDSIRDAAIDDARLVVDYDADEATIDACEQFNDDLAGGVIGVDAAVRMIGGEA